MTAKKYNINNINKAMTLSILACYMPSPPSLSFSLSLSSSLFTLSFHFPLHRKGKREKARRWHQWYALSCSCERRLWAGCMRRVVVDRMWLTQRSKRNQTMKHSWSHSGLSNQPIWPSMSLALFHAWTLSPSLSLVLSSHPNLLLLLSFCL